MQRNGTRSLQRNPGTLRFRSADLPCCEWSGLSRQHQPPQDAQDQKSGHHNRQPTRTHCGTSPVPPARRSARRRSVRRYLCSGLTHGICTLHWLCSQTIGAPWIAGHGLETNNRRHFDGIADTGAIAACCQFVTTVKDGSQKCSGQRHDRSRTTDLIDTDSLDYHNIEPAHSDSAVSADHHPPFRFCRSQ